MQTWQMQNHQRLLMLMLLAVPLLLQTVRLQVQLLHMPQLQQQVMQVMLQSLLQLLLLQMVLQQAANSSNHRRVLSLLLQLLAEQMLEQLLQLLPAVLPVVAVLPLLLSSQTEMLWMLTLERRWMQQLLLALTTQG
jgi:hypothetical protein